MPGILMCTSSRATAWPLIAVLCLASSGLVHNGRQVDPCESLPVSHDAAQHRLGALPLDAGPGADHCYLCHWARAFRSPVVAGARIAPADSLQRAVRLADSILIDHLAASRVPGRSPPL